MAAPPHHFLRSSWKAALRVRLPPVLLRAPSRPPLLCQARLPCRLQHLVSGTSLISATFLDFALDCPSLMQSNCIIWNQTRAIRTYLRSMKKRKHLRVGVQASGSSKQRIICIPTVKVAVPCIHACMVWVGVRACKHELPVHVIHVSDSMWGCGTCRSPPGRRAAPTAEAPREQLRYCRGVHRRLCRRLPCAAVVRPGCHSGLCRFSPAVLAAPASHVPPCRASEQCKSTTPHPLFSNKETD